MSKQTPNCACCKARPISVFAGCDDDLLRQQNEAKRCVEFNEGDVIFSERDEADGVYCICSGKVALTITSDDGCDSISVYEVGEGDMFGIESVVNEQQRFRTARALTDVAACFIPKDFFLDVISRDSNISADVMRRIIQSIRSMGLLIPNAEKLFLE
ncbi:hypothetical protein MASR2M18_15860 [Ignavibacteria bacterium]|nr:cyclic nucleotide-binding domain-containing protein [Bacteroidota bacterium]MCZ2133546.1 cyclic nucleotide-binding domain-containing protein [Bacteroidota bacterium]